MPEKKYVVVPDHSTSPSVHDTKRDAFDKAAKVVGSPSRESKQRVQKILESPDFPLPREGVRVNGDKNDASVYEADAS